MPEVTTISYNGFALDSLGEVSVLSQSGKMVPDKLGQKEIHQVKIRIEMFQQDYETNYNLLSQARAALLGQDKELIWVAPSTLMANGSEVVGTTILDRPVVIVSHDIPEDPNAWGAYNQQINIVAEYEVDLTDPTVHMAATFLQTGSAGEPITLGMVTGFAQLYRATKYSELRNIRDRAAGTVNLKGELFSGLIDLAGADTGTRREALLAMVTELHGQVDGRDGTLQYGLPNQANQQFFNKVVRVSAFEAQINQALNGIEWSMTADWTEFPNEAGYAAADFHVDRGEDRETGEKYIRLTGTIMSNTPTAANAKLTLLMQTVMYNAPLSDNDAGWKGLSPVRFTTNPRYINSDDTNQPANLAAPAAIANQIMGTENAGVYTSNNVFIGLDFNIEWRKKSANILSWKLTIDTTDDVASGMQKVTYHGSVVASGATATSAYNAALAQARILGDQKFPFRMAYQEGRGDRFTDAGNPLPTSFNPIVGMPSSTGYTGNGIQENIECTFSYEYRTKGQRIYLEAKAEVINDTFGENKLNVTGFVEAPNSTTATATYQTQVKALYTGLIQNETISTGNETIQTGAQWGQAAGFSSLFTRLDFGLQIWVAKNAGQFAIRFGLRSDIDYVNLKRTITLDGTYWDTQANITAAESITLPNPLDTFIGTLTATNGALAGANKLTDSRAQIHDYLGTGNDNQMGLKFTMSFVMRLTSSAQVLETSLTEEIQYSGNRNVEFATVTGASVIQGNGALGIKAGTRTVSGTVKAATEAAALGWLASQRQLSFPGNNGAPAGSALPATRYLNPPRISTKWDFLPLTGAGSVGRSAAPTFQFVTKDFSFSEWLANYRYSDGGGTV